MPADLPKHTFSVSYETRWTLSGGFFYYMHSGQAERQYERTQ